MPKTFIDWAAFTGCLYLLAAFSASLGYLAAEPVCVAPGRDAALWCIGQMPLWFGWIWQATAGWVL